MPNLKDIIEFAKHALEHNDEEQRTVEKTLPMRPEWRKMHQEMSKEVDAAAAAYAKAQTLKKAFWAKVEMDTEIYDRSMRYNEETKEIEVLAPDED